MDRFLTLLICGCHTTKPHTYRLLQLTVNLFHIIICFILFNKVHAHIDCTLGIKIYKYFTYFPARFR